MRRLSLKTGEKNEAEQWLADNTPRCSVLRLAGPFSAIRKKSNYERILCLRAYLQRMLNTILHRNWERKQSSGQK